MMKLVNTFHFLSLPILYAIENDLVEHNIEFKNVSEQEAITALEDGTADAGLISPLVFAKNTSGLQIIRDFVVSSPGPGRNALLFFSGNLKNIDEIYYISGTENSEYNRFLAETVLREYYEITPQWHEVKDILPDRVTLQQYPVILVPAPLSFDMYPDYENYLDLSEEWTLQTAMPLVHMMLCVKDSFTDRESLAKLRLSRELGLRNLMKISKNFAGNRKQSWDIYFDLLNEKYQYYPTPDAWESINNLFSYMFYYTRTDYFPELKFYPEE